MLSMILDRLTNAAHYRKLHPLFAQAFDALQAEDWTQRKDGRYELAGPRLYAMVQRYQSKPREQGKWEAHRRYIDIQYVAAGAEQLGWADRDSLRITDSYDEAKEAMFLAGDGSFVKVAAGSFVVFLPHDAHMPGIALAGPEPVTKVVLKVAVD